MAPNTTRKKKVLYVITKSNWGGAQRYVFDLAVNLPKDKFTPIVVAGGSGALIDRLKKAGIKTFSIGEMDRNMNYEKELTSFLILRQIIKQEKPDVIHLNSPKAGGLGAVAGRLNFTPKIIYTAHGWTFNENRSPLQKKMITFFSWLTVFLSHKTITVSEFDKKQTEKWPLVKKKIKTIHNGIELKKLEDKISARDNLFGSAKSVAFSKYFWLGTIAELTHNKNLFNAISAVAKYNKENEHKIFYTIIGSGELRDQLLEHIEKEGCSDLVTLYGQKEDASSILKAFDAFMLPSIKEGLPYTLLEAGLAGVPAIATPVGGVEEIIEDSITGILIKGTSADDIFESLKKVSAESKNISKYATNLTKNISENFNLEKMIGETLQTYLK